MKLECMMKSSVNNNSQPYNPLYTLSYPVCPYPLSSDDICPCECYAATIRASEITSLARSSRLVLI